ncbi:MAG: hypothetical protein EH225_05185 [Calditrichaeota bacterium]|nr:hypothetical protein [Calditrichota bacterium]RQW04901.1 MAG: hypothetical protein EH225_05185 [Calditrichota bacterium]
MKVDWFTLIAQIINFLILLVLLKYFLFDRIVRIMDRRKEKISQKLEEADQKKAEAEQELQEYHRKQQELEEQKEEILAEKRKEGEETKKKLLEKARQEAEGLRNQWIQKFSQEKEEFLNDLRREAGQQIYQISHRVLSDLADSDLENQIVKTFLKRLDNLESDREKEIKKTLGENKHKILVRTSFKLTNEVKEEISDRIQKRFSKTHEFDFQQSDQLKIGIELKIGEHKISWNINQYLDTLEEKFREKLEEQEMVKTSESAKTQEDDKKAGEIHGSNDSGREKSESESQQKNAGED